MKNILSKLNIISSIKNIFFPFYRSKEIVKIFDILQSGQKNNEKTAMFVGGCVRKYILKEEIDDIDIATIFSPEEIKTIFKGTEIKVLTDESSMNDDGSYGSGGFVGPAGDVFDFMKALDEKGLYKSNCLADAQLLAAKYSLNNRVNIPPPIIEWAASNTKISDVIADNNYYTLDGRDSMNHIMKGNIGLFLQQSYRVICNKLSIQNITNTSISENLDAGGCYGILFSGSKNVKLNNVNINNIKSDSGIALNIMYKNQNDTIDV